MTQLQEAPGTASSADEAPLLEIKNLGVTFYTPRGTVRAVRDASLTVRRGEVVGVVGESGCGKSTVAFAALGYLPGTAVVDGSIRFEGQDINELSEAELRDLRGGRVAMVYQDPATSLNPTMRVGPQLEEVLREHLDLEPEAAQTRTLELFENVGLSDPERVVESYPHELSGGMQQRVVIAMALACEPHLLVMDEPTTGLDVTTEATILDLVAELKDRVNAGIIFVSHNLGVIARVADRVVVMYAGETVEQAPVREVFKQSRHPYTAGLLECVPRRAAEGEATPLLRSIPGSVLSADEIADSECLFASRCPLATERCRSEAPTMHAVAKAHEARCFFPEQVRPEIWGEAELRAARELDPDVEPVLKVENLDVFYSSGRKKYLLFGPPADPPVRAVVGVDFEVKPGRTLGIVGESGSGKSTTARAIVGLTPKTGGEIELDDHELAALVEDRDDDSRAALRMVFQNPTASLNPRLPIRHGIVRSLRRFSGLSKEDAETQAGELMIAVGLEPEHLDRLPTEFSGGQQQRIALAAAFAADPSMIVADEAVSALDVSVQAQVLNLLAERQAENGVSYIFITHDLGVVRYVSDEILVLYAGHIAEAGDTEDVLTSPSHPYTEALLSAAPTPDPDAEQTRIRLEGAVPTLREAFTGCFFAGRCPRKLGDICDQQAPPVQRDPQRPGHEIHCHIPVEELATLQRSEPGVIPAQGDGASS
jgi:peptide/nickel transport system ATP-binding protein